MRDFSERLDAVQSIAPAAYTATEVGAEVDLDNQHGATIVVDAGAWTDGTHTFSVEKNIDDAGWEAVPASELVGAMPVIDGAAKASQIYKVGYVGFGNLRITSTVTGGPATGAVYGAHVVRHHARITPQ